MRPSNVVRSVNWRHALGELFLIVVGILVALAISDWNERRIAREAELALLQEVRVGLQTDLEALESNLQLFTQAEGQMKELLSLMEQRAPYDPSLDRLFGALYGVRLTNLNTAAYDTLKSVGLQFVSNSELRLGIARVFDHFYEDLSGIHELDTQMTLSLMRPYFLRHFTGLDFWNSATPIDYAALLEDRYFRNLAEYRLTVLQRNQLDRYAETIAELRRVLALLDREFEDPG